MMYKQPDLVHRILEINAQATIEYLNEQIRAGAQAVMIFDSWGGVLADGLFQEFSLAYTKKVVDGLLREQDGARIPVIVFTKGGGQGEGGFGGGGAGGSGGDWMGKLTKAR